MLRFPRRILVLHDDKISPSFRGRHCRHWHWHAYDDAAAAADAETIADAETRAERSWDARIWIDEGTPQHQDNSRIDIAVLSGDGVLSRACQQDDHGVGIAVRARLRTDRIASNTHRASYGVSRWATTIARRPLRFGDIGDQTLRSETSSAEFGGSPSGHLIRGRRAQAAPKFAKPIPTIPEIPKHHSENH